MRALQDFEQALSAFDVSSMASSLGISRDIVDGLGLDEFSQVQSCIHQLSLLAYAIYATVTLYCLGSHM
jgi:hypothetical protein